MRLNDNAQIKISNHVIEIKHSSDFSYLDKRGILLDKILKEFKLMKYKIDNGGIYVTNESNTITIVISDNRFAISMEIMGETQKFKDNVLKFLSIVWDYYDPSNITFRIGYRIREYSPSKEKFNKLLENYKKNFINVNNHVEDLFENISSDIAIGLSFKDEGNDVFLQTGPMKKEQAKSNFSNNINWDALSQQGIYKDIDYSSSPNKIINLAEMNEIIDSFIVKVSKKSLEVEKIISEKK